MITRTENGHITRYFDGPDDYLAYARPEAKRGKLENTSRDTHRDGWFHGSWDDALRLAHDGWREQVSTIDPDALASRDGAPVWGTRFDVSGGYVDIDRFLMGEPENMVEPIVESHRPITRFAINVAVAGSLSAEEMLEQARAVIGMVDDLTSNGRAVEVVVYLYVTDGGWGDSAQSILYVIPLKRSTDHIDLSSFAYWLGHPLSFRRIGFSALEQETYKTRAHFRIKRGGGYGHCAFEAPPGLDADVVITNLMNATSEIERWANAGMPHGWSNGRVRDPVGNV